MSKPVREIIGRLAILTMAAMLFYGGYLCLRGGLIFGDADVRFGSGFVICGIALLAVALIFICAVILPIRLLAKVLSPLVETSDWVDKSPQPPELPDWLFWLLPWWW